MDKVAVRRDCYLQSEQVERQLAAYDFISFFFLFAQLFRQFNDHESLTGSRDLFVSRILYLCVRSLVAFTMFTCAVVRGSTFPAAGTALPQLILNQAWLLRGNSAGRPPI